MNLEKYFRKGYLVSPTVDEDDDIYYYKKVKLYELNKEEIKDLFFYGTYEAYDKYSDYKKLVLVKCLDRSNISVDDLKSLLELYLKTGNYSSYSIRSILDIFNLIDDDGFIFYPHIDEEYFEEDTLMNNDYLFDQDEHILSYLFLKISNLKKDDCSSDLEKYINFIDEIIENRNKVKEERKYSKDTLSMILESLFIASNDYGKKLTKEAKEFFNKYIFINADINNDPVSIRNLGYIYYEGLNEFPIDYSKSLDYLLKYYKLTKDSEVTRTIGYIYYYNRINNDESNKDKAFQYFLIGHLLNKHYESTFKLSDCYLNGYGTIINYEAAYKLVENIYESNKNKFLKGMNAKFADVALRMGRFYKDSIHVEKDLNKSLMYFLEAKAAIKERLNDEYIGDRNVALGITNSINILKEELNISPRIIKNNGIVVKDLNRNFYGEIFKVDFINGYIHIYINKEKDYEGEYFLNVVPSIYFSERSDIIEFLIKCENYSNVVEFMKLVNSKKINVLKINQNKITFILKGKKHDKSIILEIDELIMIPQNMKDVSKKYQVVGVEFYPGSNIYDYLSIEKNVELGDKVQVLSKGETKEVIVKEIKYLYEDELVLPLNKMSKIL